MISYKAAHVTITRQSPSNGTMKKKWQPPPIGSLKFNVDEVAKGKPSRANIGGVLRNFKGQALSFSIACRSWR